ncbi:MAG: hypothetical protein RLZZ275_894, partial [Bacteroidota bacterium]
MEWGWGDGKGLRDGPSPASAVNSPSFSFSLSTSFCAAQPHPSSTSTSTSPRLTLPQLREQRDRVLSALAKRNIDATATVDRVLALDGERRTAQSELDELLARANAISREVGELMKAGKRDEADRLKAESTAMKERTAALKEVMDQAERGIHDALCTLPNTPCDLVPEGKGADDNLEVFRSGELPVMPEGAQPHWEIADRYRLIDFDLGAKVTGAGFPFYRGKGAKLQRGLIRMFLERAEQAGYEEYIPPHLVNADSGFGTGQLPDKEGQMYHSTADDLYLIPTAEVPLTNIYRDVILTEADLPVKLCGYTPCFRREAGSYGKDVRGLNRLHQFDKVEIVQLAHPEGSYDVLDAMV